MNKLLGVLAVLGVAIIYGVVITYMGWRSGGGLIPSLLFFFAARAVWLGVTKTGPEKSEDKEDKAEDAKRNAPPPAPPPAARPFAGFQDIPQPSARHAQTKFLNSGKE